MKVLYVGCLPADVPPDEEEVRGIGALLVLDLVCTSAHLVVHSSASFSV